MTLQEFPVEILVVIFKKLRGTDAASCRAVCRRWKDIIYSFPDNVWQDYCRREFFTTKTLPEGQCLSYFELYKSLDQWSQVDETINSQIPVSEKIYKVIWPKFSYGMSSFYIPTTHDDLYKQCDENDKLLTKVRSSDGCLCIVIKSVNKEFFVGGLHYEIIPLSYGLRYYNYKLWDAAVYFVNIEKDMCVARLKIVDGEELIQTEEIRDLYRAIVAFAPAGKNAINILTKAGHIYSYCDKELKICKKLDLIYTDLNVINTVCVLWEFGFNWNQPFVYEWLLEKFKRYMKYKLVNK